MERTEQGEPMKKTAQTAKVHDEGRKRALEGMPKADLVRLVMNLNVQQDELVKHVLHLDALIGSQRQRLDAGPPAAFWLVWRDGCDATPRKKHVTKDRAQTEAERLAEKHPGERFYILPVFEYAIAEVQPVTWRDHKEKEAVDPKKEELLLIQRGKPTSA